MCRQVGDKLFVMPRDQDAFQHNMESGVQRDQRALAQHSLAGGPVVIPALQDDAPKYLLRGSLSCPGTALASSTATVDLPAADGPRSAIRRLALLMTHSVA